MRHRGAESTTRLGRAVLTIGLVIAMCCASFVTLMAVAVGADVMPTIASDQVDYPPGGAVQLTGTGWQPGESVHIVVNDTDGQTWQHDVTVAADADGVVVDAFDLPDSFIANYDVTATGDVSGVATTTFTDLPIRAFDQCENDQGTGYTSGDTWLPLDQRRAPVEQLEVLRRRLHRATGVARRPRSRKHSHADAGVRHHQGRQARLRLPHDLECIRELGHRRRPLPGHHRLRGGRDRVDGRHPRRPERSEHLRADRTGRPPVRDAGRNWEPRRPRPRWSAAPTPATARPRSR